MRVITKARLREFWERPKQADAQTPLTRWYEIVSQAAWKDRNAVKDSFGVNVDFVKVASGNTVAVFDAGGNKYRVIAAIHYQAVHFRHGRVYVLRAMDHREYDKKKWIADF